MNIIKQSIEIMDPVTDEQWLQQFKKVELAYRNCYKSENKITENSYLSFIPKFSKLHKSPLEHCNITMRLICSRSIQQEITRHRLASFSIESTRYVNYLKRELGINCIESSQWNLLNTNQQDLFIEAFKNAEKSYNDLITSGIKAEIARDVLPLALKSDIIMSANVREWQTIINLRTSSAAHPDIRELMVLIHNKLLEKAPVFFEGLEY